MNFGSRSVGALVALRRDILRKIRQVGVLHTFRHGIQKLIRDFKGYLAPQDDSYADPFDEKYGTDTARIISVGALDIPDEKLSHSNRYEAVVPMVFNTIMIDLPITHEEYVFVDVGSGKGRALLLASLVPFIEIIGVEISATLTEIALNNIHIFKDGTQKCRRIRAVCADGASYEPPLCRTVLYLNNPFDDQVMQPLITGLERSLRDYPRKMFVVYQRPLHRFLWDASDAFQLIRSTKGYLVYESKT